MIIITTLVHRKATPCTIGRDDVPCDDKEIVMMMMKMNESDEQLMLIMMMIMIGDVMYCSTN
jgi:hypothetical protein